ncbi:hypothetical protein Acor_54970 [Acrocarpospora corrugata]|uniref:Uncharacterized protein n=1 Tax=Acrocarpospora corrugata TaxID=35763 RepID=A0A5M3W8K5_9ACTN|nr:hypothetical protein [Acrocarpospora corrugata]GES03431.1 hypothetical protein Acor_54970 [Acrocarpospora corrugata]
MIVRGLALVSCLTVLLAVMVTPAGDLVSAMYEFAYSAAILAGVAALLVVALHVDHLMVGAWRQMIRRGTAP